MRKKIRQLFPDSALIIALMLMVFSEATPAEQVFTVGVENIDYYPYSGYVNNEYIGYGREFLDAFAENRGYRFVYYARPVARLKHEFINENKYDFLYPDNVNWAGDMKKGHKIFYSDPVVGFIDGVMVLEGFEGGINELSNLTTIRGFTPWQYLGRINEGKIQLEETSTTVALLLKVLQGRGDGAYVNVAVAEHVMRKSLRQYAPLKFATQLPYVDDNYHVATMVHPEVLEDLNLFMKENQGLVEQIKDKYGVE